MISSAKVGQQLEELQSKIDSIKAEIDAIPTNCRNEKEEFRRQAEAAFREKRQMHLTSITKICADKKDAASALLDTFPDLDKKEYAGRYEIKTLEDHLAEIYPESLIEDYVCLNPVMFSNEQEAYRVYNSVETTIIGLKQGNFSGMVFQGLSDILDKAADRPEIGMKVAFAVVIFLVGGLVLSPFLFLSAMTLLGVASALQGVRVQHAMRQLFSVKLFLNEAYDEDIFASDKADIMQMVNEFIDDAEKEYTDVVEGREFHFDESQLEAIDKKYELQTQRLSSQLDLQNQTYSVKQQELAAIVQKLDELTEKEKKYAEIARKQFLGEVTWKKEWLQNIFLEVTSENKVKVMPFRQGNSLYYSKDIENLKKLSRLLVFQCMIQMHPDYACNYVIDYKYNGGELAQFMTAPDRIVKICFSEDDCSKQMEFIGNEIRTRTNTILGSCESIEEYNKLMAQYDSAGEYYVIVHIFGCTALSSQLLSNIRNGPRVGYFFKFYWTVEEMQQLSGDLPLDAMCEYYEVLDNPAPRTMAVVARCVQGST